jgi:hypothetical protein
MMGITSGALRGVSSEDRRIADVFCWFPSKNRQGNLNAIASGKFRPPPSNHPPRAYAEMMIGTIGNPFKPKR